MQKPVLLVFEAVAVGSESDQFVGFGGYEPVELGMDHPTERLALVRGDLHAPVVVLDEVLDVGDEHGLPLTVDAFGVVPRAYGVRVDVAVAVLRVGVAWCLCARAKGAGR